VASEEGFNSTECKFAPLCAVTVHVSWVVTDDTELCCRPAYGPTHRVYSGINATPHLHVLHVSACCGHHQVHRAFTV
jgi:hypothetical protein